MAGHRRPGDGHADHPRPTLVRPDWSALDAGGWVVEASGTTLVYRRTLPLPVAEGRRVLLHCEGADHHARVWVDGTAAGEHEGAYTRFSCDITDALAPGPEHDLVLEVADWPFDPSIPRGKQAWTPEPDTIWYRRMSGLWREVWVEVVPTSHIAGVQWVTADDSGRLAGRVAVAAPTGHQVRLAFALEGRPLAEVTLAARPEVVVEVDLAAAGGVPPDDLLWHPDHPRLVDVEVTLLRDDRVVDRVWSYTGMRTVRARDGWVEVNGRPLVQRLVLDQAYWPDTLYTAPSAGALRHQAELVRRLGFNGLRLHQTTADPRFLRACDELGLLVWADLPATHAFTAETPGRTASLLEELVARDRNHPSVVAWVLYNESWGLPGLGRDPAQAEAVGRLVARARRLDPTRLVVGNDGWQHTAGDVVGVHDYDHCAARLRVRYHRWLLGATLAFGRPGGRWLVLPASGRRGLRAVVGRVARVFGLLRAGTPVLLTEFGGVSLDSDPGAWEGYGRVRTPEALVARIGALVRAVEGSGLAGFCWTQLCDTDQEQNGLLRADRTPKAPIPDLAEAVQGRRDGHGGRYVPTGTHGRRGWSRALRGDRPRLG